MGWDELGLMQWDGMGWDCMDAMGWSGMEQIWKWGAYAKTGNEN